MIFSTTQKLLATTMAISLVGCGLHTPDYQEPWEGDYGAATRMVFEISKRVRCDLKDALQNLVFGRENRGDVNKGELDWLKTWGVQVVITLTIDEKSTFSPSVSFITPMQTAVTAFPGALAPATAITAAPAAFIRNVVTSSQQYSLGIGGSLSSDANRIGIVSYFYTVQELLNDHRPCAFREHGPDPEAAASFLISNSDLKIGDWLEASTQLGRAVAGVKYPTDPAGPFKQNVISHHIKFEVVSSGNITPTWKLVRVSANPTGNLFNTQRARTHDLLLTFGPTDSKTKQLTTPAANTVLAEQIGISVSNHVQINLGQ